LYGIIVANDNAQVTGNTVSRNESDGILVFGANTLITGNTVSSNGVTGVMIWNTSNSVTVTQNNIFGNGIGLNNTSGNIVNAQYNWWGPGGIGANAGKPGEGGNNDVSGNVTFNPWSTVKF